MPYVSIFSSLSDIETLLEAEKFSLLHRIKLSVRKKGRPRPASVKRKISQSMAGKSNFAGKEHTSKGKQNISDGRGNYDPIKGKKWYVKKASGKTFRKQRNPSEVVYQHGRVVRKGKGLPESFHSFNEFNEAYYVGNVGIHELSKFYKMASNEHKDQLKKHIKAGDHGKAWDLVKKVTRMQVHKSAMAA